jgi:hypothetical protein
LEGHGAISPQSHRATKTTARCYHSGVQQGAAGPAPAGCLSEAELARVAGAAPGSAPPELAQHLAICERCQRRALFGSDLARSRKPGRTASLPSAKRALFLTLLVLAALLGFLYTLQKLAGPPR